MDYRGRFAPSPTGRLHFGSLLAALASWLCARHAGGRWLIRVEDIDPQREVAGSAAAIVQTLADLGLVPDEPVLYQSTRAAAYRAALERLRERDLAFPCWCSRRALAEHGGVHRDGRCVSPPDPDRPPAWRLRVDDRTIRFVDALQGPQIEHLREHAGDFVLLRADGFWAYQLACAVDDAHQGITDVVRGRDLLDSTPRQILLLQLLELPVPAYRHIGLATDAAGRKLSKSAADRALDAGRWLPVLGAALRALGLPALADVDAPQAMLDAALAVFDPTQLPRHDLVADSVGIAAAM